MTQSEEQCLLPYGPVHVSADGAHKLNDSLPGVWGGEKCQQTLSRLTLKEYCKKRWEWGWGGVAWKKISPAAAVLTLKENQDTKTCCFLQTYNYRFKPLQGPGGGSGGWVGGGGGLDRGRRTAASYAWSIPSKSETDVLRPAAGETHNKWVLLKKEFDQAALSCYLTDSSGVRDVAEVLAWLFFRSQTESNRTHLVDKGKQRQQKMIQKRKPETSHIDTSKDVNHLEPPCWPWQKQTSYKRKGDKFSQTIGNTLSSTGEFDFFCFLFCIYIIFSWPRQHTGFDWSAFHWFQEDAWTGFPPTAQFWVCGWFKMWSKQTTAGRKICSLPLLVGFVSGGESGLLTLIQMYYTKYLQQDRVKNQPLVNNRKKTKSLSWSNSGDIFGIWSVVHRHLFSLHPWVFVCRMNTDITKISWDQKTSEGT